MAMEASGNQRDEEVNEFLVVRETKLINNFFGENQF